MKRNPDTGSESSRDAELLNPTIQAECGDLKQVLRYAGLRWPVFRVKPNQKRPLERGWQKQASCDPAQLRAWFGVDHQFNVGVLTGQPSGFFVLDTDPRNGGIDSLDALQRRIGKLPDTVMQQTPGGGWHYFFRMPADRDVRSGTLPELPGIDIKGTGGYVLVGPSEIDGRPYVWEESSRPGEVTVADAPPGLLALLGTRPAPTAIEEPAVIAEGARNATLASQAGKLRAMGWGLPEILVALQKFNCEHCVPPLPESEVAAIAKSIARYEPGTLMVVAPNAASLAGVNRTDMGNAERLIAHHGQDLRYFAACSQWLVWDGTRWQPDAGNEVMQRAMDTVRRTYGEAAHIDDPDRRADLAKHALASERVERLRAMITLAGSLPGVGVLPDDLDQDRYLVNLKNGTLDLRTLQLREHRRDDMITRIIPVAYDPAATCPAWLKFLDDVFDGDVTMIRYLQRAAGLCLSGDTTPRAFFILYGTGHNGKSTFLETLRDVLADYAGTVPASELMQARRPDHGKASPFVAQLPGRRFVTAMETEEHESLAASLIKTMTGGQDAIAVRGLYAKPFSFRPQFKLFIATNHRPRITDPTSSIWGRVHMVPFRVQIPDPDRREPPDSKGRVKDPHLNEKLRAELPGILAWMVAGWRDYLEQRLNPPPEVLEATRQYRTQEDMAGLFIEECLEFGDGYESSAQALSAELAAWCGGNGESIQWRAIADRLKDRAGVAPARGHRERRWTGVRVRNKEEV